MNRKWSRPQAEESVGGILWADVRRGSDLTKRLQIDGLQRITVGESGVIAPCGTNDRAPHVAADIREGRLGIGRLFGFQRPLLSGAVDLAQVVNAGVGLRP